MLDKYSKLEDKIEEGRRRLGVIGNVIEKSIEILGFGYENKIEEFLSWEIKSTKLNAEGLRVNVVEIKPKGSTARFIVNQKTKEMEREFETGFFDNSGQKEKIVFRVR